MMTQNRGGNMADSISFVPQYAGNSQAVVSVRSKLNVVANEVLML